MSTRPAGDDDRLAAVFRAASAPAHPAELAGEEAAMAAFRAAAVTAPAPARASTVRNVLGKALTVKAMVVLAIAGSAGIVVAATGGVLPTPWSAPPAGQQTPAPAPTSTGPARTTTPATPSPSAGTATPEIVDLCQKYRHLDRRDTVPGNPAFAPLVAAAGGVEKVAAYCAAHADDKPGAKPADTKTPPGTTKGNGNGNESGNGNGPGDHGRPENPGKPADPAVPGSNGHPADPPAGEQKTTEPRKPAGAPGSSARRAATPSGAEPPSQGG